MLIEIDFNSDEAIYMQVRNQIILGIATYSLLRQEGFIQLDRRKGAVVALDIDKIKAVEEMKQQLRIVLAQGRCKAISREEVHELVDEIFDEYA